MKTHVYANGLEIAGKAVGGDGVSPQAFPDPCWSPPGPPAGPVVIPYPNTCYASSIKNGTSTVFIVGKEVAIEDHSYFATSTGNEPATQAFPKGVATHVITGKAYFTQWSFDVIFEGYGVPRHTDLVSHNHGSMPSNTPVFPYISRGWGSHDCAKEEKKIERACAPEKDHSDTRKELKKKSRFSALLKAGRKNSGDKKNPHWTDDHCDGLEINLGGPKGVQNAMDYAKQMQEAYKNLPGELDLLKNLRGELQDMATRAGAKAAGKWVAKAGGKQLLGSSVPAWGNAVMGVWSVVDGVMAIGDVNEIRRVAIESIEKLNVLEKEAGRLQSLAAEFNGFDKLSPQEQLAKAQKIGSEGQDLLATLNDCTRARKCNLVPKSKKDGNRKVETADGKGCCPGQTGHHLIYGAMMDGVSCPGYEYSTAPTVCVEGFSQNHGSHGRVHDLMDRETQMLARNNKLQGGTMSMKEAIDSAVKSHQEAFPMSRCSPKCIRAQLENYYNCPGARPKALNKNGHPPAPDAGNNSDD